MKLIITALAAAAFLPGVASAQVYNEGNAGQTLGTASDTTTSGTGLALTTINGTLTAQDADLFRIYISSPGTFSATTNNVLTNNSYPGGGPLDTALFLFDATGHAIATNDDDAGGQSLTSTLAAGNSLYAGLAAGYYYLGISIAFNEPVNINNQLLFAGYPGGDTTATRGAASGVTPTTLFDFDSNAYDELAGAYRIDLTGATFGPAVASGVPEPATWAMMVMGFGAIGAGLRRRTARVAFA